ncbi:MAG: hypothetical protein OQL19_19200 [Gammaproteobacteria bacterium]|nr:hypothetical protein [Gammaproteobacteria bacterium]
MMVDSVHYKEVIFRKAQAIDNIHLRNILSQNEMESWIKLSFEREPDYFAADNLMGESYSILVYKENNPKEIMGMYSCSFLPVRINGNPQYLGYLGGLRIVKEYRNKLRYVKNGYDSIARLIPDNSSLNWWFTSIASDNKPAKKLLEAGLKGLPVYSSIGEIKTLAISANQAKKSGILQAVSHKEINELIAFYTKQTIDYQFAPILTEQWLIQLNGKKGLSIEDFYVVRQQGVIVACLALWDQRSFKQTRVKGYQFPLNKIRPLYNLFAAMTKRTPLPQVGDKLEQIYLAFVACDQQSEEQFVLILQDVLYKIKERNANMAVVGLSMENPLLALIEKYFHSHSYQTCIETVSWTKQEQPDLNSKSVQPEVALL